MKVIEFVTMKNHLPICSFVAISLLFNINAFASHPIRVACIGDSITYGAGIEDPAKDGYPAVLQRMLGSGFEVRNYGLNARVMTQEGDNPYMKETEYAQVKAFLPDIVTIMLGTNDSKPHNWNAGLYEGSYQQMINELKALPSHPDIYVCLPPPAYEDKWGINDSTIVAGVIPIIKSIADRNWLEIIDMHTSLSGMQENFVDNIHPSEAGAEVIAQTIYGALGDNGWTGARCRKVLFVGDSITDGDWGTANGSPSSERNHYDMNHIYGHGFQAECAAYYMAKYPQKHFRFYNRGLSGDRLNGIAARWEEDVLAVRPDVVSLMVGVNDSARKTSQSFDFASWEATLRNIIERTAAFDKDCRLVLCTPFIEKRGAVGRSDSFDDRHAIVERLASIVRKVADEYGLFCVDYAALMDSLLETDRSGDRNYWTWDGIHPTYAAHHKMSELWIRTAGRKLLKH